jgi:transforming growth factor-beta-induced protein
MKFSKIGIGAALLLVMAVVFGAFAPAAQAQEPTIVDIAVGTDGFSTLVAAVVEAGLVDTLSSDGPFTVFAPSNDAFNQALNDLGISAADLLANTDLLTQILLYHVAAGEYLAADVVGMESLTMVDGNSANITFRGSSAYIDGAKISNTDIMAGNGVIHVIDYVMLPPNVEDALGLNAAPPAYDASIVDLALANDGLSTLVAAVVSAGLVDTLAEGGPFTVFAPSNDAFKKALDDLGISAADLLANTDLLTQILLYHVAAGEYFAADVVGTQSITMLDGNKANVVVSSGNVTIDGAKISNTDIRVNNGVVHIIDYVMLPPNVEAVLFPTVEPYVPSIVEVVVNTPGFSTLETAVVTAGLVDTLSGDGPFTVFAPSDDAFKKALNDLGISAADLLADEALLTQILLYHVAPGSYDAADVVGSSSLTMANGGTAAIEIRDGKAYIDGAEILTTDIVTSNGIIHVIDYVMLP